MLLTNARWKMRNTIEHRQGDQRRVRHDLAPRGVSWKKYCMPTMTGRSSSFCTTISGQRYWFHAGRKVRIATVANAGPDSGTMMRR